VRIRREEVTYSQIERAATDILKTGVWPTVDALRIALGGGSARTLLDGLNRYWRDLGNQVAGPCAHTSKPSSNWLSCPPLIDTVSPSLIRGQINH
jgi:hypothetical protein